MLTGKAKKINFEMAGFPYLGIYAVGIIFLGFLTSKAYSISCYVCNSEFDPSCGDPFKPYSIGVLNCSLSIKPEHLAEDAKPVLCRKIVQRIQGTVRVIRNCGYIEDPGRDNKACSKRSGTHDVHVDYCSCTGDLCNGAKNLSYNLYNLIISVIIGIFLSVNVFKTNEMEFLKNKSLH